MTTTKEYTYKSAADFLGPDRSVDNEMHLRMSCLKRAETELSRLQEQRTDALYRVQDAFEKEVWSSVGHWATEIVALDALIREQKWYFKENSKRYAELYDRKDELKEMLNQELS